MTPEAAVEEVKEGRALSVVLVLSYPVISLFSTVIFMLCLLNPDPQLLPCFFLTWLVYSRSNP